ncbi:MAG: glycine cleavage system aminomethyltransferase GcvT [Bacteroidales bacterium]|nr:glycine cleavage system aminomethyltransferase GcvT [Bacteroidales bacterium]
MSEPIFDAPLKETCLYGRHVALGAKMSPFAGFMMPIQYDSITVEHIAVREKAGLFDVSHMGEIFVSGPDAERFVNHIFTNEIRGLAPGKILYGMMCYEDGGVVDDLLVYKGFAPERFLLVVNAANIEKDEEWIRRHASGYDCAVVNASEKWGQLAVQGPEAERIVSEVLGIGEAASLGFYTFSDIRYEGVRMIVSRTGYTGEDGFELYTSPEMTVSIWDKLIEAGVQPCGLGCRDTLRFEAGLPLYGDELSEKISPVVAGLSMFCKLDKEFIGRDALAAQKAEGTVEKLVGIEIEDRAVPRAGYPVELEDGSEVGVVTTGYHSISLDKSICFALVRSEYSALGTPLSIRIRKKVFPGKVVKKRFYQTNYKK